MKKKSLFFWFVAFVCAALIFTGCPQDADDDDTAKSGDAGLTSVLGQSITATGDGAQDSPKTATIPLAAAAANGAVKASDIVVAAKASAKLYSDGGFATEADADNGIALPAGETTDVYIVVTAEDGATKLYYKVSIALPQTIAVALDGTAGANYTAGLSIGSATKLNETLTITVSGTNITSGLGTANETDYQLVSSAKGHDENVAVVKIGATGFYGSFDKSVAHIEWQQGPSLAAYEDSDEAWPPADYTTIYKVLTDEAAFTNLANSEATYQDHGVISGTVYWKTSAGIYNKASNIAAGSYGSVTARRVVLVEQENAVDQVTVFKLIIDDDTYTVRIDYSAVTWATE